MTAFSLLFVLFNHVENENKPKVKKKKDNGVIDEPLDLLNSGLFLDSLVYRYQVASIASAVVQFCVSLSVPQIGRRARPDWDLS